MQRIGRVLHVSRSRNLILRAEKTPRVGDGVVDERLKPVGTVLDIFGPVSSPYVAVKPQVEKTNPLVNHVLYSAPLSEKRGRKERI